MVKILIGTRNPGKFREYRELLAGFPVALTAPLQEGLTLEVKECGESYAENARLKATAYAEASGLLTLADDSGLEVDALGGEPGLRSARYRGKASDEERCRLLLKKMEGVPWERRTARFRCVIAVATPEGEVQTAEGTCKGLIAYEPRGEHGFGYDPIFYVPEYKKTMAELPPTVKNRISHRAQAARSAVSILRQRISLQVRKHCVRQQTCSDGE